ncbi:DUF1508 domain-containing protein [Sessilibacter sp. MAH2]
MAATFELKSTEDSGYQFELLNSNGEVLLISAEFEEKTTAEQAIQDVRVGSMMSEMISVGSGPAGEKFFIIKNKAGQPLVKSQLFADEMMFNNVLHSVRDSACIAAVQDLSAA